MGVYLTGTNDVTVTRTVFRGNGLGVAAIDGPIVGISDSLFANNGQGAYGAANSASSYVRLSLNRVVARNSSSIAVGVDSQGTGTSAYLDVSESRIEGSLGAGTTGVQVYAAAAATAFASVNSTVVSGTESAVVSVGAVTTKVFVSGSTINGNFNGLTQFDPAILESAGNNNVRNNTNNTVGTVTNVGTCKKTLHTRRRKDHAHPSSRCRIRRVPCNRRHPRHAQLFRTTSRSTATTPIHARSRSPAACCRPRSPPWQPRRDLDARLGELHHRPRERHEVGDDPRDSGRSWECGRPGRQRAGHLDHRRRNAAQPEHPSVSGKRQLHRREQEHGRHASHPGLQPVRFTSLSAVSVNSAAAVSIARSVIRDNGIGVVASNGASVGISDALFTGIRPMASR
jgi:hypothetical protein